MLNFKIDKKNDFNVYTPLTVYKEKSIQIGQYMYDFAYDI